MIFGTGLDIVDVDRVRKIHSRWGDKFLRRFMRAKEIEYCRSLKDSAPNIAARFAAKEAISKAFGTGIGKNLSWHDLEIVHHENSRPTVKLHGKANVMLIELSGKSMHISLSHNNDQAAAMALLEV
jgi:holo-[acyl-carrier protein] synthase|tara:strand:+ start:2269 stop:2646 length:378 start_codon:yes stop_codon:yes gene_type:complete